MDVGFSINQFDNEGDVWDFCVLLHLNKEIILRFESVDEVKGFVEKIKLCVSEIEGRSADE